MSKEFNKYIHLEFVQCGGNGRLYSAINKITNNKVILKFFGYNLKLTSLNSIKNEIKYLKKVLNFKGIIQLIEVFYDIKKV